MNKKIVIGLFVIAYAIINYLGNIYNFKVESGNLYFVKNVGELVKNDDNVLFQFNINNNIFLNMLVFSNLLLFLPSLFLQYKIHSLLNERVYINLLLSLLVILFVVRTISYFCGQVDIHLVKWIGSNIYSRVDILCKFIFQFPTLPFLIYIFNKNLADKINNRQ